MIEPDPVRDIAVAALRKIVDGNLFGHAWTIARDALREVESLSGRSVPSALLVAPLPPGWACWHCGRKVDPATGCSDHWEAENNRYICGGGK